MKEIITKDSLNQSIELISELNLNDEDYEKIFEKFKLMLNNSEMKEAIKKFSGVREIEKENDLKTIMKTLINKIRLSDLNQLLGNIVKNEDLIDFIQDLFLEKLI
ncbi:MAG: hypothetical protein EU529_05835 [Promethearchaeota archaeon]|nr:MAG: hypothetical protein EU529_05835 [Candidatus Lokiarchaeota archaeon]